MDSLPRRDFLCLAKVGAVVLCLPAAAQTSPYPPLQESERRALDVGYVEDAARVDVRAYPKYESGESCARCDLYLAAPSQAWAPCTLFPRRVVAGRGWCNAYRPRESKR
jgi:hypothetical protein